LPDAPAELAYVVVNEAGASVYSASAVGREEFPGLDATLRGTISIGRRLQDPLSELVKIDPQHVGVGLYQHDVNPKQLRESLDAVIESCVNTVGVDLNSASVPLLRHVSGLNQLAAREIIEYRKAHGPFQDREQLKQVPSIGERRFTQAAGFLKIVDGPNPLDRTWVHPESYAVARQVLADLGYAPEVLGQREQLPELQEKLKGLAPDEVARRLDVGMPTIRDILDALGRPGRDPREDLPPPVFKKGILKLEDLQAGMELKGTVLNVVDFGAFIDVGLKDSGLVHISQMANRYVKDPHDVVAVGDVVTVWVLSVDQGRHRVSLTMIKPGTERKPAEKKPHPPRRERQPVAAGEHGAEQPAPPRGERRPAPRGQRRDQGPPAGERPPPGRQPAGRPPAGRPPASRGGAARSTLPPRGQRRQGPPPQGGGPHTGAPPAAAETQQPAAAGAARGTRRKTPKPQLSQAALAGKEALNSFGELAAFWEARNREKEPTPPAEAPTAPEEGPPSES
jgi:uncharacterized protein